LNRLRPPFLTYSSFRLWKDVASYDLQNEFSDNIHDLFTASMDRLGPWCPETQEIMHEPLDQDSHVRMMDREDKNEVPALLNPPLWSKMW
jgi:hypothetical protein